MNIKTEMFIKLPFLIKLKEPKNYIFHFSDDDFKSFDLEMIFNDEDIDEFCKEGFPPNSCFAIRIEAIFKNSDHSKYNNIRIPYVNPNINEYSIHMPIDERKYFFDIINKKIQSIFCYLRNRTNMFWIEPFPIKEITYCLGKEITYNFYTEDTKLSKHVKELHFTADYYMLSDSFDNIECIHESIFNNFNSNENDIKIFETYLSKAETSLYENSYKDFLIYCSISAESFIRTYIEQIKPKGDIIFNKLYKLNEDYLDLFYNILLKHLKGTSLFELKQSVFNDLKTMYKLRNSLMHEGEINDSVLKKCGLNKLGFNQCLKILESIKEAFQIINEL